MLRRRSHSDRDELRVRASQQAAVAALGQRALAGTPLERLLDEAAVAVARELDTDFASVLELTGDGRGLIIRAGAGLPPGVIDGVLPADPEELPGFALEADGPVVIDDFTGEPPPVVPTGPTRIRYDQGRWWSHRAPQLD